MLNRLVLMAAGMTGLSLGMVNISHADIWVTDPTTGCQVWSGDDGSAKEVVSWSGACANENTLRIIMKDGKIYKNTLAK